MTYNVFSGTLNPTQSVSHPPFRHAHTCTHHQPDSPPGLAQSACYKGLSVWVQSRLDPCLKDTYIHKNSDMENFICSQYGERLTILNTENIKICGWITNVEAIRNAICLCFLQYLQKIWIFNFQRQYSHMPKVRSVMSYMFCSKFHTLSSSAKILTICYDLTKLQTVKR